MKSIDLAIAQIRETLGSRQGDLQPLWSDLARLKNELSESSTGIKAHTAAVQTLLNDRILPDINAVKASIEHTDEVGSSFARALGAKISKIEDALSEDAEGRVIMRIVKLEDWKSGLTIRVGVILALTTPVLSLGMYLLGQWLSQFIK